MCRVNRQAWLWALPALLLAVPAAAQDERLVVSVGSAAMAGSGDASLAWNASVGYRFQERLLFEGDVTATELSMGRVFDRPLLGGGPGGGVIRMTREAAPGARIIMGGPMGPGRGTGFSRPVGFAEPFRVRGDGGNSDAFIGTVGLRYGLGMRGSRLQPYLAGGLGLARTTSDLGLNADGDDSVARTGMAAAAGIGTSLRVFRSLSVDVDARYFVLDRGPNLTRVGGGVSYRF
jgi:opacity protein-like surface antigen